MTNIKCERGTRKILLSDGVILSCDEYRSWISSNKIMNKNKINVSLDDALYWSKGCGEDDPKGVSVKITGGNSYIELQTERAIRCLDELAYEKNYEHSFSISKRAIVDLKYLALDTIKYKINHRKYKDERFTFITIYCAGDGIVIAKGLQDLCGAGEKAFKIQGGLGEFELPISYDCYTTFSLRIRSSNLKQITKSNSIVEISDNRSLISITEVYGNNRLFFCAAKE
jgi:hypothetical protein